MTTSPVTPHEGLRGLSQILLFGEVLWDDFGHDKRIGGAPFNVARHLQAFGLAPLLISRVGNDAMGSEVITSLTQFGMNALGIQVDPAHPTGKVMIHMEENGHHFAILQDRAYDYINANKARLAALHAQPSLLYFGTLALRGGVSRKAWQAVLESTEAPRLVDLNLRTPWDNFGIVQSALEAADIVKLNTDELDTLSWMFGLPGKHPHVRAENLLSRFALEKLLLTDGAMGAWLLDEDDSQAAVIGTPLDEVVDTVGAGDAFASVFIVGLLQQWPSQFILERADEFARAVCGIRGAVPGEDLFYQPFIQEWRI
jgi:fructokinase